MQRVLYCSRDIYSFLSKWFLHRFLQSSPGNWENNVQWTLNTSSSMSVTLIYSVNWFNHLQFVLSTKLILLDLLLQESCDVFRTFNNVEIYHQSVLHRCSSSQIYPCQHLGNCFLNHLFKKKSWIPKTNPIHINFFIISTFTFILMRMCYCWMIDYLANFTRLLDPGKWPIPRATATGRELRAGRAHG